MSYSEVCPLQINKHYTYYSRHEHNALISYKFLLLSGIFRYDCRAKKEGNKWYGRHLWHETRAMNLDGELETQNRRANKHHCEC